MRVCVENCPAHSPGGGRQAGHQHEKPRLDHVEAERTNIDFFEKLPGGRTRVNFANVRGVQFLQPSSSPARVPAAESLT